MSLPEVLFRISNLFQKTIEKIIGKVKTGKSDLISQPVKILPPITNDRLYSPVIKIFNSQLDYSEDIDWHLDLSSSKRYPEIFSKNINILNEKAGCAKYIWEINRLLFLPQLCLNYIKTKDNKYLDQFIRINDSWICNNPYLIGINWSSNIEINIRLINWFLCWEILDASLLMHRSFEFKEFVEKRWLPVIYLHCIYSYKNPSRFSSANNHLISEYAGLFIASSLWKFKESEKWNAYAKKGLETEIQKQHSENGINKEEAAEYIQFVTDFLLLAYVVGEKTDNKFSQEYAMMLKKIFYYIYRFTDINCNSPKYGDEDDGRVIILDHSALYNNFKSLLTSGAVIFNDPGLKSKSGGFDMKNRLLFGEEGEKKYIGLKKINPVPESCIYKKEGHFIMHKKTGNKEIHIHFNAAPLGYLSIAAHGHSDALSFVLHVNGEKVIVDPGTFTYHTHNSFRQYFIGTLAHNTIRINKKNQALNGGPTLWLKHYKTSIKESVSNNKYDKIIASHNGYRDSGVFHTRKLVFNKVENTILISDSVKCNPGKEYFLEFPIHLHPDMLPQKQDDYISVFDHNKNLIIKIFSDPALNIEIIKGQMSPVMGWYSESFYIKEPAYMIYQTMKSDRSAELVTKIAINLSC